MSARPLLALALLSACQSPPDSSIPDLPGPPSAPVVVIEPPAPTSSDDLVVVVTTPATADSGAAVGYRFAWEVDGDPRPELVGSVVPASATAKEQRWRVVVTPIAEGAPAGAPASAEVFVANSPPVVSAWLGPADPSTLDDLNGSYEAFDPDGDPVEVTVGWTLDGEPIEPDAMTVPAVATRRGETYALSVTASDDQGAEATAVVEREVLNSLPRVHGVQVEPAEARVTDDLTASASVYDADGDPASLLWVWRVDGAIVREGTVPGLPARAFAKHQEVTVEVIADDGVGVAPAVRSAPVRILNTPPTAPLIRIGPSLLAPGAEITCEVTEESVDADGDALTYAFAWTLDGEAFEDARDDGTTSRIPADDVAMHQLWTCEVHADDGEERGPSLLRKKQVGVPGKRVGVGHLHTCVIREDEALFCWGYNAHGQLGDGTTDERLSPVQVAPDLTWADVSASEYHTCAVTTAGELYCWGRNDYGQLGDGSREERWSPTLVDDSRRWEHVGVGLFYSCGRTIDGEVLCWGSGGQGTLGGGSSGDRDRPTPVSGEHTWAHLDVGPFLHACATTTEGDGYCWGNNQNGRLGDGSMDARSYTPKRVTSEDDWQVVRAGYEHTCGLTTEDRVRCWGENGYGQIGDGSTEARRTPVAVSDDPAFRRLLPGLSRTCALDADDDLWCWGENGDGQFGNGTFEGSRVPVRTVEGYVWKEIAGRYYHLCGFTDDEELLCWGRNWSGQLGDGTTSSRARPTTIRLD